MPSADDGATRGVGLGAIKAEAWLRLLETLLAPAAAPERAYRPPSAVKTGGPPPRSSTQCGRERSGDGRHLPVAGDGEPAVEANHEVHAVRWREREEGGPGTVSFSQHDWAAVG